MEFNVKKFKNNIPFFTICISLIVVFLLLGLLTNRNSKTLDKKDFESGDVNISKLVINEIMTANKGTFTDPNGKLYDYIEIYNGNDKDINLKDYGLSDESKEVKWVFPSVTIEAKSYLIVYLSGTNGDGLYTRHIGQLYPGKLKILGKRVSCGRLQGQCITGTR